MIFADSITDPSLLEEIVRLLAATLAGAIIGFDRERSSRPAGLRTNTLVAVGSATFTLLAISLVGDLTVKEGLQNIDPTRIIAYVISGIGFLGAGAIIQARGRIRGLTTAAGVWVVASIGMTYGAGYYSLATVTLVLTLVVLRVMRHAPIERREREVERREREEAREERDEE